MIRIIALFVFFSTLTFVTLAQNNNNGKIAKERKSKITLPVFLDSSRVEKDLFASVNIDSIFKPLVVDSESDVYGCYFEINTLGVVERISCDAKKRFESIDKYIQDVFRYYKWVPAFKKNKTEKIKDGLYFRILFEGDEKRIIIEIQNLQYDDYRNIYSRIISY